MQIEKPIENWTKFPNCILDNINIYSPTAFTVLAFMVRRCLGFQNPLTEFSLSFLINNTGLTRNTVRKGLKELIDLDSIYSLGKNRSENYMIKWSAPIGSKNAPVKNSPSGGSKIHPLGGQNLPPFKETIQIKDLKDNIYTDTSFLENQPEPKKTRKKKSKTEIAPGGLSLTEKKEIIDMCKKPSHAPLHWYPGQIKHMINLEWSLHELGSKPFTKEQWIYYLTIYKKGITGGAFWKEKNNPNQSVWVSKITINMLQHLDEWASKNKNHVRTESNYEK
jgi:hypothetical protein